MHHLESDSNRSYCLKLDEFLELENIHSQLVNFHITEQFKFQSYFVSMFFFFNEENLQFPEIVFTYEIINNTFNYMNLIMAEVYIVIFHDKIAIALP